MMRRTSLSPSAPRWRRRARRTVVAVVLLAGTGAAVVAVRDRSGTESAPTTTASVLEVAQVSAGDLSTTESIDGTLTETGSIVVLHRIEGQTSSSGGAPSSSSSSPSSSSSSGAAAPSSATAGATAPIAAAAEAEPAGAATESDCVTPDPAATTPATAEPPATSTSTSTTTTTPALDATGPTVDPTQPSAPPTTVTAVTTVPTAITVCATIDPSATSTTSTAGDTTTPALPTGAAPGGAAPSGNAGAGSATPAGGTGSGASSSSSTRITQLVTWVAPVGTSIGSGDALYSIEGAPVIAMYGDLPAWRSLSTASDDGVDVLQLESNLRALGFDRDAEMTIDRTFDSDTAAAVERWQAATGVEVTGEVSLGTVVFAPAATAVTSTSQTVGDEIGDGDTVVTLAGTTQQIVITVAAEDQPYVEPGTAVTVSDTAATVVALRSAESSGTVTVQAVIVPSEPLDVADGSAVKVRLTIEQATSVLLVPSDALVSRLDGTYAVQTSAEVGEHEFVTVEVLGVSNGMAGIRGEGLTEGTSVWVPA